MSRAVGLDFSRSSASTAPSRELTGKGLLGGGGIGVSSESEDEDGLVSRTSDRDRVDRAGSAEIISARVRARE